MGMRNVILLAATLCLVSCVQVILPDPVDGGAGGAAAAAPEDPPTKPEKACTGGVDALKCEAR